MNDLGSHLSFRKAGEPPCGCGPGATECDYHLGWWDGYAASRNQSVGHLVAVASEWHERDCNCLCDCGDCNKPADPCELGALLRGYGNVWGLNSGLPEHLGLLCALHH